MSALFHAVADRIDKDLRLVPRVMQHIDDAINGQRDTVFAKGKEHRIVDHLDAVAISAKDQIRTMLRQVEHLTDVQNIILTGGGAKVFKPYLDELLNDCSTILVDDNPLYSNLLGFQLYGEHFADVQLQA